MSTPGPGHENAPSPVVDRRRSAVPTPSPRRRRLTGSQWLRVTLATVLVVCTAVAFRQQPDPDPFDGTTLADVFLRQRETNAFRRGPVIRGNLLGIYATPGGDRVWIVGDPGLITFSADGGRTWNEGNIVAPPEVREQDGSDTGRPTASAQVRQPEFAEYLAPLRSAWFTSDSVGWIGGDRILLKSTNGGRTWEKVGGAALTTVQFVNPNDGWAFGDSAAFRTGNGKDWNRLDTDARFAAVEFTSRSVGWAVDVSGTVLRTETGTDWRALSLPGLVPGSVRHASLDALSDRVAFVAITTRQVSTDSAAPGSAITQHFLTEDGGGTWSARQQQRNADITSIRFLTRSTGVSLTRDGVIYRTTDGAATWRVQQRLPIRSMTSMYFADRNHGIAVGAQTIWMTSNAGRTWRYVGGGQALYAAHFFNERRGVAVGQNGIVASTTDGGKTWTLQDVGIREDLHDVAFMSNGRGWAIGSRGTLLFSRNRGSSWRVVDARFAPSDDTLGAIHTESYRDIFLNDGGGWIVGSRGAVIRVTSDGRLAQHSHIADESLRAVDFATDSLGWALGVSGLWQTRDGGSRWELLPGSGSMGFSTIEFLNEHLGWAAAGDTIFRTSDGGRSWTGTAPPSAARVHALRFASPYDGWAAGRNGHIWTTRDGGRSWVAPTVAGMPSDLGPDLYGLTNFSDTLAWAVGEGGTVVAGIRSSDWGVVSKPPTRELPGWWVMVMAVGGVLLAVTYRLRNSREVGFGIDDMFATDRPLQANDPDRFEFSRLARGLSRFLRNEATSPPLTVAVTGPWGTGKTSLMNLVQRDLKHHRQRTVWFNAWDHNEEEQLLASLLTSIQVQAIPKIVRPWQWLRFRVMLFWVRMTGQSRSGESRPAAFIALVSLAVFLGWSTTNVNDVSRVLTAFAEFLTSLGAEGGLAQFVDSVKTSATGVFGPAVLLVSGISAVVASWRTLRVFGLNPSKVATSMGKRFALRDTAGTVGYRHRFAEDFGEMVRALDSRLVIFVDDLDRCDHDCVYRVLEAINFLSAAGECIVVLGTDRDLFRASLARHFQKAAKELKEIGGDLAKPEFTGAALYAEQFLEKLINIEVPVPEIEDEKLVRLIRQSVSSERTERVRSGWGPQEPALRLTAAFWIVLLITSGIGRSASDPLIESREGTVIAGSDPQSPTMQMTTRGTPLVPEAPVAGYTSRTSAVFDVSTPVSGRGPLYFGLALLAATFIAGYLRRPDRIVHDAPDFVEALNAWSVLVAEHASTPRRLKRYLNCLRYYAMVACASGNDDKRRWERMLEKVRSWLPQRAEPPQAKGKVRKLEQPVLVALASIELCKPEWLTDVTHQKQLRERFREFIHEKLPDERYEAIRSLKYPEEIEDQWQDFSGVANALRRPEAAVVLTPVLG